MKNISEGMISMIEKMINGQFVKGDWKQVLLNSFSPAKVSIMVLYEQYDEPWVIIDLEGQQYNVCIKTSEGIVLVNQLLRMLLLQVEIKFENFQQYANLIQECMTLIRMERSAATCHQ